MIESCRGSDAKKKIINENDIAILSRLKMYNGQTIEGCCGSIKTEYFVFLAKHKQTEQTQTIIVGTRCGREFLSLLGEPLPKLFDAVSSVPTSSTKRRKMDSNIHQTLEQNLVRDDSYSRLTPLNRQLYDAVHLLISSWGGNCSGVVAEILMFLREHPDKDTQQWAIEAFARVVAKDARGRSLTAIAAQLRVKNAGMKFFKFDLLNDLLPATIKPL